MTDPAAIISRLQLAPHPEGGWYRETWRAAAANGQRPTATAIHFLLEAHQRSHWHRVDAAELWFWHAGAPIALSIAPQDAGPVTRTVLGGRVLEGEAAQVLVPIGHWQAAEPLGGWALVSCVVSPGFHFGGFELAAPDWSPGNAAPSGA
ncbi:cupin domain-containing protein [Novosphingobium sp. BL-8H]|uniref:cupin domain-containing protein n=1 Tax=Novosphingobium sp. BL-8H TaxID=3127640 RepID=UPI0037567F56